MTDNNIDETGGVERFMQRRGPGRPRLPPARKITIRIDEELIPFAEECAEDERRTLPAWCKRVLEDAIREMQADDEEEDACDDE